MIRYKNINEIIKSTTPKNVVRINTIDKNLLKGISTNINFGHVASDVLEMHVYDLDGNILVSNPEINSWKNRLPRNYTSTATKKIFVDIHTDIRQLGFTRGEYKVVYNFLRNLIGTCYGSKLFIKEVSPSRREIKVSLTDINDSKLLKQINDFFILKDRYKKTGNKFYRTYDLNFGNNEIIKVINISRINSTDIGIKLYEPLPNEIELKQQCWLTSEVRLPYVDNISLIPKSISKPKSNLKGPNFNLDNSYNTSTESDFKTWNDLLGSNVNTSQQIIDQYFSGSLTGIKLNIDYCEFENFIHFSSAEERVKNFKYKLELIEYYSSLLSTLSQTTGSVENNILETVTKRNSIISGFDDFEKYLYFESGSGLYTHHSCSISPWPKQQGEQLIPLTWLQAYTLWRETNYTWVTGATEIVTSPFRPYSLYSISSSVAETYYNNLIEDAREFDTANIHALVKAIPEHIRNDELNTQFDIFVNMMGHHFDIPWAYINHLTKKSLREEHPQDGMSSDLIYDVAKSMGWNLTNGNQLKHLWQYKLGSDESGEYMQSGSMPSKSSNDLTKEVWRRILNNLPYLLKSKGTERSIRALTSCYGVPSTILRIREYGGPKVYNDTPKYIYDKFTHALQLNDNRYIQTKWAKTLSSGSYKFPDTITIRFKPHDDSEFDYRYYTPHTLLQAGSGSSVRFFVNIEKTGSQGSQQGNIKFYLSGSRGFINAAINDVCIFDGNFSTLTIRRRNSSDTISINNRYDIFLKKPVYGKLVVNHTASLLVSGTLGAVSQSYNTAWATTNNFYLGLGANLTNTRNFTGSIQELRFWNQPLSESIINNHTLSPGSYNGNNATSSYEYLRIRFPFIFKTNHGLAGSSSLSSVHPNQNITTFSGSFPLTCSFIGFSNEPDDYYEPIEDKFYTDVTSIGSQNIYSDKIRIEQNELIKPLSYKTRSEKSSYDLHPVDSNRLGVYFSPQDIINEDIFHQIGFTELDDYIGNPADYYKTSYSELRRFSEEYWKKYPNKNDIAAYLRVFSLYDFSLFKQIEQLLPARANRILGLLIEPNVLERSKIQFYKPTQERLDYSAEIPKISNSQSADYSRIEGLIEANEDIIECEEFSTGSDALIQLNPNSDGARYSLINLIRSGGMYITASNPYWESRALQPVITGSRFSSNRYYGGRSIYTVTDWMPANSVTQFTGSNTPWQNISRATGSADSTSSIAPQLFATGSTYQLVLSNFGFDLTGNTSIRGIEARIRRKAGSLFPASYVKDKTIAISKRVDNLVTGANLADTAFASSSAATPSQSATLIRTFTGGRPWTSTSSIVDGNITTSGSSQGLAVSSELTERFCVSGFGHSIPTNATIKGITVYIRKYKSLAGALDTVLDAEVYTSKIVTDSVTGDNKANAVSWSNSATTVTYGGSTDLWGQTWTPQQINSGSFGVILRANITDLSIGGPVTMAHVNIIYTAINYQIITAGGWAQEYRTVSYGSPINKWGQTWTPQEINSGSFNIKIQTDYVATASYVDNVELRVHYRLTSSLEASDTQDYLPRGIKNHRYEGCKMSSPSINSPSNDTIDNGPVVESILADSRQLILQPPTTNGNFTVGDSNNTSEDSQNDSNSTS